MNKGLGKFPLQGRFRRNQSGERGQQCGSPGVGTKLVCPGTARTNMADFKGKETKDGVFPGPWWGLRLLTFFF